MNQITRQQWGAYKLIIRPEQPQLDIDSEDTVTLLSHKIVKEFKQITARESLWVIMNLRKTLTLSRRSEPWHIITRSSGKLLHFFRDMNSTLLLPWSSDRERAALYHQRRSLECEDHCRPVQGALADRALLQMDQAEPQGEDLPGYLEECGTHPDMDSALCLSPPGVSEIQGQDRLVHATDAPIASAQSL